MSEDWSTLGWLCFSYLSRNDINLIEPNGFMNLTSLKRLFLDHNEIGDSSLISLNKLPALEWLWVSDSLKFTCDVTHSIHSLVICLTMTFDWATTASFRTPTCVNCECAATYRRHFHFVQFLFMQLTHRLLEHNVIEVIDEQTFFNLSSLTYLWVISIQFWNFRDVTAPWRHRPNGLTWKKILELFSQITALQSP